MVYFLFGVWEFGRLYQCTDSSGIEILLDTSLIQIFENGDLERNNIYTIYSSQVI